MYPTFKPGDELLVFLNSPTKNFSPTVGDVLVVRHEGEWVAHRVVRQNGNLFLKGDQSPHIHSLDDQPLGLVAGFRRQNEISIWGEKGQRFKKTLAFLSLVSSKSQGLPRKIFRFAFRLALLGKATGR